MAHVKKNTIPIVLASDDRFRIGLLATIRSIGRHLSANHELDINILDCGFSSPEEVKAVLEKNVDGKATIRMRPVPLKRLASLGLNRPRLSKAAFARLFAPSLLPDLDRVLYLDSDLLVTDDLARLWEINLGGKPLGAVPDPYFIFLGADVANCRERGVSPFHRYFGSGVLLMDLQQWRDEGAEKTLVTLGEPGQLVRRFNDQSVLNFYFAGRVCYLPKRWNQLRFHWNRSAAFAPRRRGIVHVGGSPKPWDFPENGAVGVNRLYRTIMQGAHPPPDWLPEEYAQHPPRNLSAVLQTAKLLLRSGPLGYFHSCPHILRWKLEGTKLSVPDAVAGSTTG